MLSPVLTEKLLPALHSKDNLSFCKKMTIWLKKVSSIKQLPISTLKAQISELNLRNSIYTKPLNLSFDLLYILIEDPRNALELKKILKMKAWRRLAELSPIV